MGKLTRFLLISSWIVFTRFFDLYSTYNFTPDLSREANPIVSVFRLNWWSLIIIIGIITVYIIYVYYCRLFKYGSLFPSKKNLNFIEFITYLVTGESGHWTTIFYKLPTKNNRINNLLGHILPRILSYVGVITSLMWILTDIPKLYEEYYSPIYIYASLILGSFIIVILWLRRSYKEYLLTVSKRIDD